MTSVASRRVREVPAKTDPTIPGPPRGRTRIDVRALKRALRAAVAGEVRFDPGTLALYANDASNFRQVPIGVVIPRRLEDVVAAHQANGADPRRSATLCFDATMSPHQGPGGGRGTR
jgi:hypothetical protein